MTLREKQSLFARLLAELLTKATIQMPGVSITMADGSVDQLRRYRDNQGDLRKGKDAVHMDGGCHYMRLAQDLNLFVNGSWIQTAHPMWDVLGVFWESLSPLCRWGGRFPEKDWNHFSVTHAGKS